MSPSPAPNPPSPSSNPPPPVPQSLALIVLLNILALLAAALWLRSRSLGNIPGINGDEAWYGVQALRWLGGETEGLWRTPTGNAVNPLYLGPLTLLHAWFPPSFVALRSVAWASGLAALAVNWGLCRWVFDRRTAWISTIMLAVLPINIAYGRFGWDASQSLAVTLPVAYLSLAAVRFPDRWGQWLSAAVLASAVAFWVHPTNLFCGAAVAIAGAICCRRWFFTRHANASHRLECTTGKSRQSGRFRRLGICLVLLTLAVALLAVWAWSAEPSRGPLSERLSMWRDNLQHLHYVGILFPRLFTGGTIYRYIAGSRSWFEWPLPADSEGWGLDVVLFLLGLFAAARVLYRPAGDSSGDGRQTESPCTACDRALPAMFALEIIGFFLIAGPRALIPGQERFALCLIGPTVLLVARGAAVAWQRASAGCRNISLALAFLAAWAVLADFHAHYFQFIERTGGQSHRTFRTAAEEPKQAALAYILESAPRDGPIWIVCSEWWNDWPIRYLAMPHSRVVVTDGKRLARDSGSDAAADYRRALADGRAWFVEFSDTDELREVETRFKDRNVERQEFFDYAGRSVLTVLRPL